MKRKMKLSKKKYSLKNSIIEKEMIDWSVVKKITRKALDVIYACSRNSNSFVLEILEGKHIETQEDLEIEVYLKMLGSGYIFKDRLVVKKHSFKMKKEKNGIKLLKKKEVFGVVNSILYKKKKELVKRIELVSETDVEGLEKASYINFLIEENINSYKEKRIDLDGLTSTQREIVELCSRYSQRQVAEMLGISRGTVSNTILRLRKKLEYIA
jgi:RNA polymerase sigma factor (sigma-70 family)